MLSEDQKELILNAIADGKTMAEAGALIGLNRIKLMRLVAKDPNLEKEVELARAAFVHELVDSLVGITKDAHTMAEVQAKRLDSDNIKWIASKFAPRTFGENLQVNVQHHLDLSSILLAAENRVLPLLRANENLIDVSEISEVSEIGENHASLGDSGSIEDLF